jgi:S1-C subfamily serine protease
MPSRLWALSLFCCILTPATGADLPATIAALKPSVVGVGSYLPTRSPAVRFSGTGFAVGDGRSIITNAHVIPTLEMGGMEKLGIVIARGEQFEFRPATLAGLDREHDLAHLVIGGAPLPALQLGDGARMAEGRELAFTGFPLGMVLGLHPVTHHALLAAITPVVMPSLSAGKLGAGAIAQLGRTRFPVYQLDATAYPGNSGSPVYEPASGEVVGVINMVFVKGLKESAISNPSGITYAVPVVHVRELLQRNSPGAK